MTKKWRKVLDEVGDQISGEVYLAIRNIDANESKITSLKAIETQMQQEADNATFQLVTALPTTGKNGIYYIKLDGTTNKYEEWVWNGATYDKVGVIGDSIYPTLLTVPVYDAVDKDGAGYSSASPNQQGWYEYDENATPQYALSQDGTTYVLAYTAVDKTGAGYSESVPTTEGWYEYDEAADPQYALSQDATVDGEKTYYVQSQTYPKTYYSLVADYEEILTTTSGYSSMNPKHLDWLYRNNQTGSFLYTDDRTVENAKTYYVYTA